MVKIMKKKHLKLEKLHEKKWWLKHQPINLQQHKHQKDGYSILLWLLYHIIIIIIINLIFEWRHK